MPVRCSQGGHLDPARRTSHRVARPAQGGEWIYLPATFAEPRATAPAVPAPWPVQRESLTFHPLDWGSSVGSVQGNGPGMDWEEQAMWA